MRGRRVSRAAVENALRAMSDPRCRDRYAAGELPDGLDGDERALVAAAADDYPDEARWPGIPDAAPRTSRGISGAVLELAARAQGARPEYEWTTFAVNAALWPATDPHDLDLDGHPAFEAALAYADGRS